MNNLANKATFWSFLKQTRIRIPRIQRDYAQGRIGKESLREKFLSSIFKSLNGGSQLKLDFIYGSGDGEGNFSPLDGQQRLTTLWLIYWYLAYRTGELKNPETRGVLGRFSYETRESSKSFIKMIVEKGSEIALNEGENIADAIMRQSWMFTVWRQDPTVQSMLRMLSGEKNDKVDGIEELFDSKSKEELKGYWELLLSDTDRCPVVFYQLDIDNMGQSDDLYVKMNGRGKALTDFENFKADLIKYFEERCEENEKDWAGFLHPETGYPILLDTVWTDFFWKYRTDGISFDDLFFTFINRFFLILMMRYVPDLEKSENGTTKRKVYDYLYSFTQGKDYRLSYSDIGFGRYSDFFELIEPYLTVKEVFGKLMAVLSNMTEADRKWSEIVVNSPYYSGKTFTPVYVRNDNDGGLQDYYSITQPQIIAFWAVCYYFDREDVSFSQSSLGDWMRLVWNVSDFNDEIRSRQAVISAIYDFSVIVNDPVNAYQSLLDSKTVPESEDESMVSAALLREHKRIRKINAGHDAFDEHIREEREKIAKMLQGNYDGEVAEFKGKSWNEVLKIVESSPYMTGTIRCLLLDGDGNYSWNHFGQKYQKIRDYGDFGDIAIRNYLIVDYQKICRDYWYGKNSEKHERYWRRLLSDMSQTAHINVWLLTNKLDEVQLEEYARKELSDNYERYAIIGTGLLKTVEDERGLYIACSSSCGGKRVLLHHQASKPYVVMYKQRNSIVKEMKDKGIIRLCNPGRWLDIGMFDGKNLVFEYDGRKYVWGGDGVVRLQTEHQIEGRDVGNIAYTAESFKQFIENLPKE